MENDADDFEMLYKRDPIAYGGITQTSLRAGEIFHSRPRLSCLTEPIRVSRPWYMRLSEAREARGTLLKVVWPSERSYDAFHWRGKEFRESLQAVLPDSLYS